MNFAGKTLQSNNTEYSFKRSKWDFLAKKVNGNWQKQARLCRLKHAVAVCCLQFAVCCLLFIFSATHKCNTLCHEAITVQVTIFWVCSTFFGFQLEFHDVNLVKLWTGKSMKIYRSFVTTIWNQVTSLLSVKLSRTHLVSCTVMATWHRVLH